MLAFMALDKDFGELFNECKGTPKETRGIFVEGYTALYPKLWHKRTPDLCGPLRLPSRPFWGKEDPYHA